MPNTTDFSLERGAELLSRTPALLDAWLRDLGPEWLHADEGPDTFSPYEVVGHLVQGERSDWIPRVRHVVEGREGAFTPFDRSAHRDAFADEPIGALLDAFAEARRESLDALAALDLGDADLARTGTHPAFGEVTLRQLFATWVVHDQGHVAQIARVLAKQYATEVGPWREYLPVLGDRERDGGTSES